VEDAIRWEVRFSPRGCTDGESQWQGPSVGSQAVQPHQSGAPGHHRNASDGKRREKQWDLIGIHQLEGTFLKESFQKM
jgi:hypothetical protein